MYASCFQNNIIVGSNPKSFPCKIIKYCRYIDISSKSIYVAVIGRIIVEQVIKFYFTLREKRRREENKAQNKNKAIKSPPPGRYHINNN